MTIELPSALREKIQARVSDGGFHDVSDYLCTLVEHDLESIADPELEALLLKGLEGKGTVVTNEWWDNFRERLVQRHQESSKP